jgi:uncharacterized protein (TIGR02217 family)
MAFLAERISDKVERGAKGGPMNNGRFKAYSAGGQLTQLFTWAQALHKWNVSHGIRTLTEFENIRALWWVVNFTPYEGFLFRDWTDYQATQTNSRLTLVTGSTYQMERLYKIGSIVYGRKIQKPCDTPTPIIYRTRSSVVTVVSGPTIDYTTGKVTISGHVAGDTYTWEGLFDIPVTFVNNEFPSEIELGTGSALIVTQPIELEEFLIP